MGIYLNLRSLSAVIERCKEICLSFKGTNILIHTTSTKINNIQKML